MTVDFLQRAKPVVGRERARLWRIAASERTLLLAFVPLPFTQASFTMKYLKLESEKYLHEEIDKQMAEINRGRNRKAIRDSRDHVIAKNEFAY